MCMNNRVTIYRDDWGCPHIYAKTEEDGFYGVGYAQAEDKLQGILIRYLMASGKLASVFGPDYVDFDFNLLRWRHLEEARGGFNRLNLQHQKNYSFFLAGIQRYMDDHQDEVPSWAPKLEPALPIAWCRWVRWRWLSRDGLDDCIRGGIEFYSDIKAELESSLRWPESNTNNRTHIQNTGSNEWTLSPWRTADNVVYQLTDSHLYFEGRNEKFECRIDAGALKTAGFSTLGEPLPYIAHTKYVGWSSTVGCPDYSDCYEVKVDPENPLRYKYDDEWKTMITREVTVAVKGGQPVKRTFEYTEHNEILSPVVARRDGKAYVVCTSYMHEAGLFEEQVYRMTKAKNINEFKESMTLLGLYGINCMAGDVHGNTFYVRNGRVPIRPSGFDWTKPIPGNTSETAWKGIHPFEDLVQIENPDQGYMQNCNIAPDTMMENSPLTSDRYPAYIFNDSPGRTNTRGIRAVELLSKAFNITVDEFIEFALDDKWIGTSAWQEALRRALNKNMKLVCSKPQRFRHFVHRILHFDGFARADSVAALNYFYWRETLASMLSRAELEEVNDVIWEMKELTADQNKMLLEAIDRAIKTMIIEHGSTNLRYGDVFRAGRGGFSYSASGGTIQAGSEFTPVGPHLSPANQPVVTLRAFGFTPPDSLGLRWVFSGAHETRVTIYTNPIQSFTAMHLGQSDRPDSPHYSDQARLISERRLKPTYFYKEDLLKHVTSTKTLEVYFE